MAGTSGWWGTSPEHGTPDSPRSALNLRLLLAVFGLVSCAVMAVLLVRAGLPVVGWILAGLAAVALVDIVVIQRRRIQRRRREPGVRRSLFE
jgi:predicted metal-binding membrane protein